MKKYLAVVALVVSWMLCGSSYAEKPNIILITASNLGYSDLGCYGGEIRTPVLDKLASEGLQFSQFYSCGNSAMSQAALMTGQAPHRVGMGYPLVDLRWDNYRGNITEVTPTLAEYLKSVGYTTLSAGKWNLTSEFGMEDHRFAWPLNRGMDKFYGTMFPQTSYFEPVNLLMNRSRYPLREDYYYTYEIGREAANFLENAPKNRPFFLYVAFTAPSWPLQAPMEEIKQYSNKYRFGWDACRTLRAKNVKDLNLVTSVTAVSPRDERVVSWSKVGNFALWQARRMEVYAAQVSAMDRSIGMILEKVHQLGADENTLIIFLSDAGACADELTAKSADVSMYIPEKTNGGSPLQVGNSPKAAPGSVGVFQSYGVPWANVSNTPFRGYSDTLYEGGLATPCIFHWGGRLESGKVREPACVTDIFPTLIEISESVFPRELNGRDTLRPVGQSLVPLFTAKERMERTSREKPQHRYFCWECRGNCAVRYGNWKLVKTRSSERWELYNLFTDRGETKDVYAQNASKPEIVAMIAQYDAWRRDNRVFDWNDVRNRYRKIQASKSED